MKVSVAYVAVVGGPITSDYCARFVSTWCEYPPGIETDLIVLCNGGPLTLEQSLIFSSMDVKFFPRKNDPGYDLSAYLDCARQSDADMLVCLGESVHFHREGWLARLSEAWSRTGPGMYGPFASNLLRPHLQTTAFATSPTLLRQCPISTKDRYQFEHGTNSFWRWVASRGMPVRLVTWDGEWEPRLWRTPKNVLWRGDQSNCLLWANHTDRWRTAEPEVKARWSRGADRAFR